MQTGDEKGGRGEKDRLFLTISHTAGLGSQKERRGKRCSLFRLAAVGKGGEEEGGFVLTSNTISHN